MAAEEKDKNLENGQGAEDQTGAGAGSGSGSDGAGTGSTGSSSTDKGGADTGAGSGEKTFTQAEVTKMMAREKHQGVNSVYNELGIKPGDKKSLAAIKEYLASQKSEEQKKLEAEAAKAQEVADAEQRATMAEAKAEAMMIGVQAQFVDDAVTLALAKVAAEDGTDIKTALGELKTKYPVWFGSTGSEDDDDKGGKDKVGQKGTGSSVKSTEKDKGGEAKSLGARLAAKKRGSGKSTYWGAKK